MEKYSYLINTSSYSLIFIDIQRGIESLGGLVSFFSQNVNGGISLCLLILFQTKKLIEYFFYILKLRLIIYSRIFPKCHNIYKQLITYLNMKQSK